MGPVAHAAQFWCKFRAVSVYRIHIRTFKTKNLPDLSWMICKALHSCYTVQNCTP